MARVTVEDCLSYVDNRFQLVVTAAKRARSLLASGAEPDVSWDNDKATVVALREIAEGNIHDHEEEAQPLAETIREDGVASGTAEDLPPRGVE